jgi:hypothetical protein
MFIFRNSLISSGICIAFIFILVPRFGIPAYIFGWLVSLVVVIALGLRNYGLCDGHYVILAQLVLAKHRQHMLRYDANQVIPL